MALDNALNNGVRKSCQNIVEEYAEYITEKEGETKEYHLFLQYIAYVQWMQLKEYANSKNVKIIVDYY